MSFEVNRRLVAKRSPLETDAVVDSVTAGIIRGAFETFCFETAIHLGRSASSAIINQSNERNASIIDAHGRLAGISVGIPQLLFISPLAVRWGLEHFEEDDWGPGDVFVGNDPDHGGGHLPDYTVYSPCFDADEKLVAIQAIQAHQGDTGGKDPGGFSVDSIDIFHEGMPIPVVKLVHRGQKRRDIIAMITRNNRLPSFPGDLAAMISAAQLGARLLDEGQPEEQRHVAIDHRGETSVPGFFVVGDAARRADEPMMMQIYTAQEYAVRAVDSIDSRRRKRMRSQVLGG